MENTANDKFLTQRRKVAKEEEMIGESTASRAIQPFLPSSPLCAFAPLREFFSCP
jgi:hypothetical protein